MSSARVNRINLYEKNDVTKDKESFLILIKEIGNNEEKGENLFASISAVGDLQFLKSLVEAGADIHLYDDFLLRRASYCGHLGMVKFLVEECGADPKILIGTTSYDN